MNNENENMSEQTVTAIAKSGSKLKAVELCKRGGTIEVTKTKSSEENVINWQDFAVKCGLSIVPVTQEDAESRKAVVVGYDSAGTAFSRVNIPAMEDKELEAMVQLQAESRLPLPADQMELAWRADPQKDGQLAIIIAAARRQQIQSFVDKIISFKPMNIFLDCEGIVKVWKSIFSGSEQTSVIINADARNTQICLVNKGQLINAVALDMGIDDFAQAEAEQHTENIERFVQDTRSIVDLFGIDKSEKMRVFVLSDGSSTYNDLASSLKDAGLNAAIAKPDINKFNTKSGLTAKDIFEYRLQIGLALMVIDAAGNELNLFRNLYKPFGEEKQTHWLYSLKITGSIAAAVLILFLGVCYAIDATKPGKINDIITKSGTDVTGLVEQQKLLKAIEQQRPDLLKLISELTLNRNESLAPGTRGMTNNGRIQLDSLDFKKGKKVTITGQASDNETLYDFENRLNETPGISAVEWTPSTQRSSSAASGRTTANTRTSTNTRTSSATARTGTSVRTSNGSNGRGGMSGFNDGSIRFSMEFSYMNFSGNAGKSTKKSN